MPTASHDDKQNPIRVTIALLTMALLCVAAYALAPASAGTGSIGEWYSILPPLVAIGMVLITRQLIVSMVLGVVVGGLLVANLTHTGFFTVTSTGLVTSLSYMKKVVTDDWNMQVLAFIPFMLAMISLMITAGAFQALVRRISHLSFGRRMTQVKTFLAGLVIFFDDYANTMVVGSGMRPFTDRQKISRAKLAFLVDATSAPIAGLAIMSTWIGYEIGLFKDISMSLGIGRDGFTMFLDALGFRFYCMMMIGFVLINALSGRDFASMLSAERTAFQNSHHQSATHTNKDAEPHANARHSLLSLFLPLGVLFTVMLGGFWRDGGGTSLSDGNIAAIVSWSNWQAVLISVENSITVLMWAGIAGFATALGTAYIQARVPIWGLFRAVVHGVKLSLVPMAILCLAWGLKEACDGLGTGNFLVAAVGDSFPAWLFPAALFVTAALTAFATGTSWGTMAILIPTAIPVAFSLDNGAYGLITIISLSAVLDGSILGDHCSPISDTTIMSSTASSCNHLEHVRTQLPYALLVGFLAIVLGYIPAASGFSPLIGLTLALLIIFAVHYGIGENCEEAGRSPLSRYLGWYRSDVTKEGPPQTTALNTKAVSQRQS